MKFSILLLLIQKSNFYRNNGTTPSYVVDAMTCWLGLVWMTSICKRRILSWSGDRPRGIETWGKFQSAKQGKEGRIILWVSGAIENRISFGPPLNLRGTSPNWLDRMISILNKSTMSANLFIKCWMYAPRIGTILAKGYSLRPARARTGSGDRIVRQLKLLSVWPIKSAKVRQTES